MATINGIKNKVAPRTISSVNGAKYISHNGIRQLDYDKWKMVWNGNHFAPPDLSSKLYLPGVPGAGATIFDFGGSTNGTVVGATWMQLPTGLPYLSFDGTDDYVTIDDPAVTTDEIGTVSMWVNQDSAANDYLWCYVKQSTDNVDVLRLLLKANGYLQFETFLNTVGSWIDTTTTSITVGTWHKITMQSDGSTHIVYVDGIVQAWDLSGGTDDGQWFADCQTEPADTIVLGGYYRNGALEGDLAGDIALFQVTSATRSADNEARFFAAERHLFGV